MKTSTVIAASFSLLLLFALTTTSCKKTCYDCVKKCGSCTSNGIVVVAGCEGDTALNGFSVEAWEVFLESPPYNYNCSIFNGDEQSTCDEDGRDSYVSQGYRCTARD